MERDTYSDGSLRKSRRESPDPPEDGSKSSFRNSRFVYAVNYNVQPIRYTIGKESLLRKCKGKLEYTFPLQEPGTFLYECGLKCVDHIPRGIILKQEHRLLV